jgi:hypothetical protein
MLRMEIVDTHNQTSSNDFLVEAKKPGIYAEKIALKTLSAWNCDPTKGKFQFFIYLTINLFSFSIGFCDDFPVGTYNVTAQLCNGECDSHHPHSSTYAFGKGSFTVTKKK